MSAVSLMNITIRRDNLCDISINGLLTAANSMVSFADTIKIVNDIDARNIVLYRHATEDRLKFTNVDRDNKIFSSEIIFRLVNMFIVQSGNEHVQTKAKYQMYPVHNDAKFASGPGHYVKIVAETINDKWMLNKEEGFVPFGFFDAWPRRRHGWIKLSEALGILLHMCPNQCFSFYFKGSYVSGSPSFCLEKLDFNKNLFIIKNKEN